MKYCFRFYQVMALFCGASVVNSAYALIIPIDLNDFFADPTVTVAADGSTATLAEDPFFSPVLLSNDPGLGDPVVIVPGAGTSLLFDFTFSEPAGNDDAFVAFVLDAATGLSFGSGFEFGTESSSSGAVSFDLSSLVGETLGLQFELGSNFGDGAFDSLVMVSNVRLDTAAMSVPEPSVLSLLAIGIFATGLVRLRRTSWQKHTV